MLLIDAQLQVTATVQFGQKLFGEPAGLVDQLRIHCRADEVEHLPNGKVAGRPLRHALCGERRQQVPPQSPAVEVREEAVVGAVRTRVHRRSPFMPE